LTHTRHQLRWQRSRAVTITFCLGGLDVIEHYSDEICKSQLLFSKMKTESYLRRLKGKRPEKWVKYGVSSFLWLAVAYIYLLRCIFLFNICCSRRISTSVLCGVFFVSKEIRCLQTFMLAGIWLNPLKIGEPRIFFHAIHTIPHKSRDDYGFAGSQCVCVVG
jgi:hypothetical protein